MSLALLTMGVPVRHHLDNQHLLQGESMRIAVEHVGMYQTAAGCPIVRPSVRPNPQPLSCLCVNWCINAQGKLKWQGRGG